MEACQSGFHSSILKFNISKISLENGYIVNLCDRCFSRIMNAKNCAGDQTMEVLYYWAKEHGNIPEPTRVTKK